MKKLLVTLAITGIAVGAFAQGTIQFQNTGGAGKEKFIYNVDASNPTSAALGGVRAKVEGAYSAQLFVGAAGASEADLKAIDASLTTFKSGATAGLLNGNSKLAVQGMLGGVKVTLQLRVWDSSVASWAEVIRTANDGKARGKSNLVLNYELAGVDADNAPHIGSLNLANFGLSSFGLYIVPEPSVIALGALGLGALVLRRRK